MRAVALMLVAASAFAGCLAQAPIGQPGGEPSLVGAFTCLPLSPCRVIDVDAPPGAIGLRLVVRSEIPGSVNVRSAEAYAGHSPGNAMEAGLNAWVFTFNEAPANGTWSVSMHPMSGSSGTVEVVAYDWLEAGCVARLPPYEEGLQAEDAVRIAREHWAQRGEAPPDDAPPTVDRRYRDADLAPAAPVACPERPAEDVRDVWSVQWAGRETLIDAMTGEVLLST